MKKSIHKRLSFSPCTFGWKSDFTSIENCSKFLCNSFLILFFAFSFSNLSAQVQVEVEGINPTCGGFTNGSATAYPSGGWDPYSFLWSNGETTQSIFGLGAGTYTVTATDLDGGYNYGSVTLTSANQTDADFFIEDICSGNGNVTINASGGTPPYTYNWIDGFSGPSRDGLATDTQYCVTVLDDNLCGIITCGTIPVGLELDVVSNSMACSNSTTGSVEAFISGGDAPYDILWSNGVTTALNDEINAGTYTVTVTDNSGCTTIGTGTVNAPSSINLNVNITSPLCSNSSNGGAIVFASGGIPNYSYQWNTGATTQSINGLAPGNYSVTVTDAQGCTESTNISVTAPNALSVNISKNNPTCNNQNGGVVTANASNGTPGYSYLWNTGSNAQTIAGLGAGNYSVTVTDANGCQEVETVTLSQEGAAIFASISEQNATCGQNNGGMTAFGSNGSGNYSYSWSNGANTQMISNLSAGTYTVTITDSVTGCTASKTESITNTSSTFEAYTSDTNSFCGENNGTASAFTNGGVAPFTYLWSTGGTTQTITGIGEGSYSVTVTDANGCSDSSNAWVDETGADFEAYTSDTNSFCGENNGTASAFTNGGVAPFTYLWSTGGTTQTITGIGEGNYTVTVTDANGCSDSSNAWVDETGADFEAYTSDTNSFCGENNGTASAFTNGGVAPFTYLWSTGGTTQTITGIGEGSYSVTVTDANGCSDSSNAWVDETGADFEAYTSDTNSFCGENNGTASAFTNGGVAPFTYLWSTGGTTQTITGIGEGNYTVTVTDANGCSDGSAAWVDEEGASFEAYTSDTNSNCGANNGTASAFTNGGVAPFTYLWNTGGTTQTITGIGEGNYTVTVTDANGCSDGSAAWVDEEGASFEAYTSDTNSNCGANNGTASAFTNGGVAPFTYLWNTGGTTQTITGIGEGNYTVTVTDATGCSDGSAAWIDEIGSDMSVIVSGNDIVNCIGENTGSATATVSGGAAGYDYSWSNGANTQTIIDLTTGFYSVTVTDSNGCTKTGNTNIVLGEFSNISCSILITNPVSSSNSNDGELTASISNGSGSYSYAWSNGGDNAINSDLAVGTYNLTVTDNISGCTTQCSISLFEPAAPTAMIGNMVFRDVNIDGDNDDVEDGVAGITVTLTGTTNSGVAFNQVTTTDVNGLYLFDQLEGGNYRVIFSDLPEDFVFTTQYSGNSDDSDSDVNIATGMTAFFNLADGESNLSIDAGVYPSCECDNFTNGGTICCSQTSCGPGYDPDPITELNAPSGGSGGTIEYVWMFKEGLGTFDETLFAPIPNSNSPTYDPGPIYSTTSFFRCSRRGPCCPFIEANGVVIYINDDADATFEGPAENILCQGETYTYSANTISSTATYQWIVEGNAETTDLDEPSIEIIWSSNGVYEVELTVIDNACTASIVESHLVTNSPDHCDGEGEMGLIIDATVIHSAQVEIELIREPQVNGDFEYTIERSKLGEDFEEIGFIDLNNSTYYKYEDNAPFKGRSFYRVKMTNELGYSFYSNIEEISIFVGIENTMVYPNPFTNSVNYEILDTYGEDVRLEIISPDGRIMRTFITDKDTFQQTIDTNGLATGIYFLKFHFSGTGVQTYKMLKQ